MRLGICGCDRGAVVAGVVLDDADVAPAAAAVPSVSANANAVTLFFNTAWFSIQSWTFVIAGMQDVRSSQRFVPVPVPSCRPRIR